MYFLQGNTRSNYQPW